MHVEVPRLSFSELEGPRGEGSASVRARVTVARAVQLRRNDTLNCGLDNRQLEAACELQLSDRHLLQQAMEKLNFSARAYHRILKVARTIADLDGSTFITTRHLTEAIHYRQLDRGS
jgi:magnesium chelatase family protein